MRRPVAAGQSGDWRGPRRGSRAGVLSSPHCYVNVKEYYLFKASLSLSSGTHQPPRVLEPMLRSSRALRSLSALSAERNLWPNILRTPNQLQSRPAARTAVKWLASQQSGMTTDSKTFSSRTSPMRHRSVDCDGRRGHPYVSVTQCRRKGKAQFRRNMS